jgi:hypothetical protein
MKKWIVFAVTLLWMWISTAFAETVINPSGTTCTQDSAGRFWVFQSFAESTVELPGPPQGSLQILTWGHVHDTTLSVNDVCHTRLFRGVALLSAEKIASFHLDISGADERCWKSDFRGEVDYNTLEITGVLHDWDSGLQTVDMAFTDCVTHP